MRYALPHQQTCDPCPKCKTMMVWAEYLSPQGIESICLRCPKCNHKASKWLMKPAARPDREAH